jgi:hypothetical protein
VDKPIAKKFDPWVTVKMRQCTPLQATGHDSHRRLVVLLDTYALVHSNPRSSSFSPQQAAEYTDKIKNIRVLVFSNYPTGVAKAAGRSPGIMIKFWNT